MKKNIFYLFSLILLIIFFFIIQEYTFKYISKYFADKKSYNFIKKYINETNHIRSHVDYSICEENNKPQCLLFNKISRKKPKKTIYINGDSWAEGFRTLDLKEKTFTNFSKKNNLDIILAGVTSYSFSPMLSQLKILNRDWNINPEIIVSIFDQTDIGDELCRYKNFRTINSNGDVIVKKFNQDYSNEVYNYTHFLERHEIFYSDNSKIIKLLKLFNLQLNKKKNKILKPKCSFDIIQNYLMNNLSKEDNDYLQDIIKQYIKKVFQYNKLKKLFIVTHPHKKHLQNIYKLDIGDIIEYVVNKSPYKEKIILINFTHNNYLSLDDFVSDDPASHLNHVKGYPKYANFILEEVLKELN